MPEIHEIVLEGCTPEPLMNYLKALGVLRIVAQQADPGARGAWRGGAFLLRSSLDRDRLVSFFRNQYCATPIVSPWNGDGGFLTRSGTSAETIKAIKENPAPRFHRLQHVIRSVEDMALLRDFGENRDSVKELSKKKTKGRLTEKDAENLKFATNRVKEIKDSIVLQLRSHLPDESLVWLDACMQISADGFSAAPVLGSGGCDGHLEFSANYLANLLLVTDDERSEHWLRKALLNDGNAQLVETSIGQYAPGRIGGPNATQGMEGRSMLNPWDFVLMIEGVLLLAGSTTRKLSVDQQGRAAFPFTVLASEVGSGSLERSESRESRGELWLPLWERFASLLELSAVFAEGRAQLSRRQSQTAVDFARAVASLGIDRGIRSFSRQGFLKRNGLAFLATPLGRFDVHARDDVQLIRGIDGWLKRLRRACGDRAPARFLSALRRIDAAIFDFCQYGGKPKFAQILCALGQAERELARGARFRDEARIPPIPTLSPAWLEAANDHSVEFELALSLAGIHDTGNKTAPLRANLEPVDWQRGERAWADKAAGIVWNSASLSSNLIAILERRLIEGTPFGGREARVRASLSSVAAFICEDTDDRRLEELLWGAILINRRAPWSVDFPERREIAIPRAYALLKLLFLPSPLTRAGETVAIRPEMDVLPALRRGDLGRASQIALRRLRASGITPLPHRRAGMASRNDDWGRASAGIQTTRLAAALLFPISEGDAGRLCNLVARPDTTDS